MGQSKASIRESLKQLIHTVVSIGVWVVGLVIAATVVLPGLTPASLVAGLGVGTIAIGFAFQDFFQNFLAGILIMVRKKMRIGDVIECEGIIGKVEHISLRETHVRKLSNELPTDLSHATSWFSSAQYWFVRSVLKASLPSAALEASKSPHCVPFGALEHLTTCCCSSAQ